MSQISIIMYSDVLKAKRFDAEFFKTEYLEIDNKILSAKHTTLGAVIDILTDYHANGSYKILSKNVELLDTENYALMIRTVDFETNNFTSNCKFITHSAYDFLKKTKMFGGEIIINKIGNAGRVYFLPDLGRPVSLGMNQFMIKVNKTKINNYYLYIFLISTFGSKSLKRRVTGAVPLSIDKQSVRNVLVPIPSNNFQLRIEELVKLHHNKQHESKQLNKEAEEILLGELGLLDYATEQPLTFSTTRKEVEAAKRFDAEYFQPKYERIIKHIENYNGGFDVVKNIVHWKKGVEVGSDAYTESGKEFVRVSDCSTFGPEESSKKISASMFGELQAKYQPKRGEIIFTKDGTIGIASVLRDDIDGVLSSAFLSLKLKAGYKNYNKDCLTLILNSFITKMQVEKLSGGAIIAHLKPSDFEKFKLPLIRPDIQQEIADKITRSHQLRKESKELLEEAKRRVEEEIESNAKC